MVDYNGIVSEIRKMYLSSNTPWVIGFSGGKDSTTVLQMIFYALSTLLKVELRKEIHVLSNDTLVENPAIAKYLTAQLALIRDAGKSKLFKHDPALFHARKVRPRLDDTFWVNLIGRGYPSPNRWFRWCTDRLKIAPTSDYISARITSKHRRVIIVLGTRKSESSNRAVSMKCHENGRKLRKHTLRNCLVFAPIADLTNNDVWAYLLQSPNPWGGNNRKLLALYGSACSGGECPFVIETGTQSCGKSRFGCWVCTVVDKDRSMESFIDNGESWMQGLLDFRNWLFEIRQEKGQRIPTHVKRNGLRFGAFTLKTRRLILSRLLATQSKMPMKLILDSELDRIRELLKSESVGKTGNGMREFVYRLPSSSKIVVISDVDILLTPRKRLGPLHLKNARLLKTRDVCPDRFESTRIIYYRIN